MKKAMKSGWRPILLLALSASAFAEDGAVAPEGGRPRVELRLAKKDGIQVGDVLDVELSGTALPPEAKLRATGGLAQGWSVSESGRIGALKPGVIQLPALEVVDASGQVIAETDPVELRVESALSQQPTEDGKPPQPEPPAGPQTLGLPVGLQATVGLVFTALLGAGLFFLIRWLVRKLNRSRNLPPVVQTADAIALRRLKLVESEKWYEKGHPKRHFFEISEALKAYFSDRYSIDASESTTTELMEKLSALRQGGALESENFKMIQSCFSVLDLVKFTDYRPETSESVAQLEEARQIVMRTRQPFVPHSARSAEGSQPGGAR